MISTVVLTVKCISCAEDLVSLLLSIGIYEGIGTVILISILYNVQHINNNLRLHSTKHNTGVLIQ